MLIAPRPNDKLRPAWVWKSTPVAQLEPLRRTGKTSYDWLRSRPAMPHWRIAEKNVFGLKLPCSLLPNSGENLDRGVVVALSWKYDVFDGELPLLERTTNETLSSLAPMAKPWFFRLNTGKGSNCNFYINYKYLQSYLQRKLKKIKNILNMCLQPISKLLAYFFFILNLSILSSWK